MAVGTSHDSFDLVAFTALPYLTVNARAAPSAFPCKYLIAVSANYLRCKWIAFRPVGIGFCPMLLQILFPAFYFKLYTFPYPLWNDGIMVILHIKHLNFPFVLCTFLFAKVIPFSKSLLFSKVSNHPTVSIFKCFIQKTRKHTSIIFLYYSTIRRKSRFLWKQTNGFNIPLNFDFILHSESMSALSKVG